MYKTLLKRPLDFLAACLIGTVALPIALIVGIGVRAFLGTPVLFRQQRGGYQGKPFELFKFRSMTDARDAHGRLLPDEERLTRFGKWLRKTSLDELPQLVNVLRGDMSLVGPRPLLVSYLDRYNSYQERRHEVRPGVTGWTQVKGRNSLSWDEKFHLDVWYVEHCSLGVDLNILALTFMRLVQPTGISADGHSTMPEFLGSEQQGKKDQDKQD